MNETIVLQTMPRMVQSTAKTIEEITKILLEIAAQHRDNELVKSLLDYGKLGGNLDFEICRSFAISDYDTKLTEHGIPHAIIFDKVTGLGTIITRDIDREAVLKAKNELFVEQRRVVRLTPDEFFKLNVGKNIEIITDRTQTEAKAFQQTAKKYGLTNIAFKKNAADPDKVDIYFNAKDADRARKVLCMTEMSTLGVSGNTLNIRVAREIEFQQGLMKTVQQPENDFYVVSRANPNEYIHFNKDGLQYFKDGKLLLDEARSSHRFVAVAKNQISGLVSPVKLSKEEFEISPETRAERVRAIEVTENSFLSKTASIEQSAQQLIVMKLEQDPELTNALPNNFVSTDVSFFKMFDQNKALTNKEKALVAKFDELGNYEKALIKTYVDKELSTYSQLLKDAKDPSKDFYVVSGRSTQEKLHFSNYGLEHTINGKTTSYSRSQSNYDAIALEKITNMTNSVKLTKEEFEVPKAELKQTLRERTPAMEEQLKNTEKLERMARALVEKKLSLDNFEQVQIPTSFYNPNVSFREFVDIEKINDEEFKQKVEFLDKLEDKEKILVKNYIKDTFEKTHSADIVSSYIDETYKDNSFEAISFEDFNKEHEEANRQFGFAGEEYQENVPDVELYDEFDFGDFSGDE